MSTRTIIEINHDHLNERNRTELLELLDSLRSSAVAGLLARNDDKPVNWSTGIRILMQRHHSEDLTLKTKYLEVKA